MTKELDLIPVVLRGGPKDGTLCDLPSESVRMNPLVEFPLFESQPPVEVVQGPYAEYVASEEMQLIDNEYRQVWIFSGYTDKPLP